MDKQKCGEYIRRKREARGLSQAELAEKLGVSTYEISAWEAGFFPEAEYLLPLSATLGVEVEELLSGEDAADGESAAKAVSVAGRSAEINREEANPEVPNPEGPKSSEEQAEEPEKPEADANDSVSVSGRNKSEPSARPVKSAKAPAEESYYEKLHKKLGETDWEKVIEPPSGENGFSDGERRFGIVVCVIFILIVIIIQGMNLGKYINRERELTLENYREYIEISVHPAGEGPVYTDLTEQVLEVTAKKEIRDFSISVKVCFSYTLSGDSENTVFREAQIREQTIDEYTFAVRTFFFDRSVWNCGVEVLSVEGKLP